MVPIKTDDEQENSLIDGTTTPDFGVEKNGPSPLDEEKSSNAEERKKEEEEEDGRKSRRHKSNEVARLLLFTDASLLAASDEETAEVMEKKGTMVSATQDNSERNVDLKEVIRGKWEFAASMQFLHTFGEDLNLGEFYTEDVEEALVSANESTLLIDLHIKLMKGLITHGFPPHDWQLILGKIIEKYLEIEEAVSMLDQTNEMANNMEDDGEETHRLKDKSTRGKEFNETWENPMSGEDVLYWSLSVEDKVVILHKLCEWQLLDIERFRSRIKNAEERESDWRVEPMGYDAKNNTIWLFDDNRLYQESKLSGKKKSETQWRLLCSDIEEWDALKEKWKHSRSSSEKALSRILEENILPVVLPQLHDKMKQMRKRELHEAFVIKRSTRSQSRLAGQKVEGSMSVFDMDPHLSLEKQSYLMEQTKRDQQVKERDDRLRLRDERIRAHEEEKLLKEIELAREREERLAQREKRKLGLALFDVVASMESERLAPKDKLPKKQKGRKHHEPKSWYFECLCGLKGTNYDDGTDMIQCIDCLVWQHIACDKKLSHFVSNGQNHQSQSIETQSSGRSKRKVKQLKDIDFLCRKCLKHRRRRDKHLRKKISRLKTEIKQIKESVPPTSLDNEAGASSVRDSSEVIDVEMMEGYNEPPAHERRLRFVFKTNSDPETASLSDQLNVIITDSNISTSDEISPHLASDAMDMPPDKPVVNEVPFNSPLPLIARQPDLLQSTSERCDNFLDANVNFLENHGEPLSLDFLSAIASQRHEVSCLSMTPLAPSTNQDSKETVGRIDSSS